ncbi:hypothetical protein HO173_008045 [Letharia columbiana]|uniref:CHCH domain-containing protein n=1 Tax=Letharia columbiana TaxID=112416 RepID=A0A8H6FSH9_9LECA|nr:uncharacterized protein HO173_008045 [Letharia columbiana]KAF6233833.1 hypothetical protein HO173_008045 [Letharia columbiana]
MTSQMSGKYRKSRDPKLQSSKDPTLIVAVRDKRIFSTGCSAEQAKMNDCYFDKKDWRTCRKEMEIFRECWKRQGNDQRTETKDA